MEPLSPSLLPSAKSNTGSATSSQHPGQHPPSVCGAGVQLYSGLSLATAEITASSDAGGEPEQKPGPSVVAPSEFGRRALGVVLRHHFTATAKTEPAIPETALRRDGALALRLFYHARRHSKISITTTDSSFAALEAGSVVTWGYPNSGGVIPDAIRDQLRAGVTRISATNSAFAALKADGSVVTWGNPLAGGDSESVRHQLGNDVQSISASGYAFAAIKSDGSVVTWGDQYRGGDSRFMRMYSGEWGGWRRDQLRGGVESISATRFGFAAIKSDGSVVGWGLDQDDVLHQPQIGKVRSISATQTAYAAIKLDGSVVAFGGSNITVDGQRCGGAGCGANISPVQHLLTRDAGVRNISATGRAFAAIRSDGRVVTWGDARSGGDSKAVQGHLRDGVRSISATGRAFAAIKSDGSVVTWGDPRDGGDSAVVRDQLGAVRLDRRGGASDGGDSRAPTVQSISATSYAFAALLSDGSVVTWGNPQYGGDSQHVRLHLASDVQSISATSYVFAAIKLDGSVVTWGGCPRNPENLPPHPQGGWIRVVAGWAESLETIPKRWATANPEREQDSPPEGPHQRAKGGDQRSRTNGNPDRN